MTEKSGQPVGPREPCFCHSDLRNSGHSTRCGVVSRVATDDKRPGVLEERWGRVQSRSMRPTCRTGDGQRRFRSPGFAHERQRSRGGDERSTIANPPDFAARVHRFGGLPFNSTPTYQQRRLSRMPRCRRIGYETRPPLRGRAVAQLQPHHLRRTPSHHTQIVEVFILRHDRKPIQPGMLPDLIIAREIQPHRLHVAGIWEQVSQTVDQLGRQIMVEKQFHATATSRLRSRSAAKAKQA